MQASTNDDSTSTVPDLESERLRMTEISQRDAEAIFTIFSSERCMRFYDVVPLQQRSEAEALIEGWARRAKSQQGMRWGIRLKSSDALIGTCGLNSWSPRMKTATLGYDLREDRWGQGFASEAVRRLLTVAFEGSLPCGALHRIQADTVPGNDRSEGLLRRLGFVEEGLRRGAGYWKDQHHDLKCFGLLRPEFKPAQPRSAPEAAMGPARS